MRLSQNCRLLKIIIAPSDSYRNLKGVLIFSDIHPLGREKMSVKIQNKSFETASIPSNQFL